MHARTVQEDRARYQRGCTQSCPFTEGHAGVRAIEQCSQKSRDASCTPEVQHGFERRRLRGLTGARNEFHLAAIVQNLKTMALRLPARQQMECVRRLRKRLGRSVLVFADKATPDQEKAEIAPQ